MLITMRDYFQLITYIYYIIMNTLSSNPKKTMFYAAA